MGKQARKSGQIYRAVPYTWMKLAGRQTLKAAQMSASLPCDKEVTMAFQCQEMYVDGDSKGECKELIQALYNCVEAVPKGRHSASLAFHIQRLSKTGF